MPIYNYFQAALLLYQDHLDLRAVRERRLDEVLDADGVSRPSVEAGHGRTLTTVFGEVTATRLAYRRRGQTNLHPADTALNLPAEKHSHGLRRLAAVEAARGSFDDTVAAIARATGQRVGKRQVEELLRRAAVDIDRDDVRERVHAGVRAPRDREVADLGEGLVERSTQDALDRRVTGLRRPPAVWRAVVLDR